MQRRYREKWNDQALHEKVIFPLANLWMVLFLFLRKCPLQFPCSLLCYVIRKRSNSRSQMFSKTGALKNFATFAGKYLYWSLFLKKFQDWRSAFLFKKTLQGRRFFVNIEKFFSTAFLLKTCSLYLLKMFIWWDKIDILELYFTIVKLGYVTERTSEKKGRTPIKICFSLSFPFYRDLVTVQIVKRS